MNKKYYIWSKKWTKGWVHTFWRPDNKGYTINLNEAGIYTKDELHGYPMITRKNIIKMKQLDNDKHDNTFAIAVEDVELLGKKMTCIMN